MAAINEELFVEMNEYGDGIYPNEYDGLWSIGVARKNKDTGDVWAEWAYPQKREDGKSVAGAKTFPIGSCRVEKRRLIESVERFLRILKGEKSKGDTPF